MVVEGYVFGTTRQYHNADRVAYYTAVAFDLEEHWYECVSFVERYW